MNMPQPSRRFPLPFTSLALLATLFLMSHSESFAQSEMDQGSWVTLTESEGEPAHRHENAYVKAGDKLYLVGGRGERLVDIYDPANDRWTRGATPPLSMHHFQGVSYNGSIYVMGAFNGNYPDETPISHVYIYHPASDQWEKGPEIPADRRRGAAGAVAYNSKIYLVGGIQNGHINGHVRWFDSFDPETETWERLPDIPRHRDHFQVAIVNDKLYAAGGRRTSQATGQVFELTIPEVDVFDFTVGTWEILPPSGDLPTERAGTTALSTQNRLIVIGGESSSQQPAHSEVEALDPSTGHWESLPPLNTGRHGVQAVLHNGRIYIAAGSQSRGADEINSQEVLDLQGFEE